jgi:hypothetical protein
MRDVPQSQRNRHFFPNPYINGMDQNPQRRELEEHLARCRKRAREFTGSMTKNLRELAAEIEQEIRALEQ